MDVDLSAVGPAVERDADVVVELTVSDLGRAVRFWTAAGFRLVRQQDGFASLRWGGAFVFLATGDARGARPDLANVRVTVGDLDAHVATLRARGLDVPDPVERPWGLRVVAIADPDGWGLRLAGPTATTRAPMRPRLTGACLAVSDVEAARRFYGDVLGLPEHRAGEGFAMFDLGGAQLALYRRADLAADAGVAPLPSPAQALWHNVPTAADVDALVARATAAGARVTREPAAASWGGRHAWIADPEGHLWEIAHNPAKPDR